MTVEKEIQVVYGKAKKTKMVQSPNVANIGNILKKTINGEELLDLRELNIWLEKDKEINQGYGPTGVKNEVRL
jgi:hypothetical protein